MRRTLANLIDGSHFRSKWIGTQLGYTLHSWRLIRCGLRKLPESKRGRLARILKCKVEDIDAAQEATLRRRAQRAVAK